MFSLGRGLRGVCIFIQSVNPLIWRNTTTTQFIPSKSNNISVVPYTPSSNTSSLLLLPLGLYIDVTSHFFFEAPDLQQLQKQKSYQSIGLTCTWHLLQITRIPLEEPMAFKLAHPNRLLPCTLCPLRHTTNLGFLKKSNLSFGLRDDLLDERPTDNDA